jgi:glycosyltransferase involved in cell wall biosynthesis
VIQWRDAASPRCIQSKRTLRMSLRDIHPYLITRDAAATIDTVLTSLADFPSVVVYDNGSTDDTIERCRRYPNVRVETGPFYGFGPTYNHAAGLADGDWVLSVHADEELSRGLVASLAALEPGDPNTVYTVDRHNLFLGRDVRRGGWGRDYPPRLYHRRVCRFNDAPVHENLILPAGVRTVRLAGPLWHQAVTDIDQFLKRISYYSELRRRREARIHPAPVILLRAFWAFFRSYGLQLGVLEGWRGMVIAWSNATGTFFRHMKRHADRELERERRDAVAAKDSAVSGANH